MSEKAETKSKETCWPHPGEGRPWGEPLTSSGRQQRAEGGADGAQPAPPGLTLALQEWW